MSNSMFNPALTHKVAVYKPGDRLKDYRGMDFVYVRAKADISRHAVCTFKIPSFLAEESDETTSARGDRVGVALETDIPKDEYGWICVYGYGRIKVRANCKANDALFTNGVGYVDDSRASDEHGIQEIVLNEAGPSTDGLANANWQHPWKIND